MKENLCVCCGVTAPTFDQNGNRVRKLVVASYCKKCKETIEGRLTEFRIKGIIHTEVIEVEPPRLPTIAEIFKRRAQ